MINVNELLPNIATLVPRCPRGTLVRAYMKAAQDFCGQSRWLRETVLGASAPNVPVYSLGSDPNQQIIGIRAMSGSQTVGNQLQIWKIDASDSTGWDPNYPPNLPILYQYLPEGQFALFPLPNGIYDLTVTIQLQPLQGGVMLPSALIAKWQNELDAGALAYLYKIKGQAWSDPQESIVQQKAFQAGINNARADEQRSYNTGSARARPRRFIV